MNRRLLAITAVCLAVFVALDLVFAPGAGHDEFWYHIPGFFAAFGFLGCVLIVLLSKWLGHSLLQRREDYYER